jgi:hypothetical protein
MISCLHHLGGFIAIEAKNTIQVISTNRSAVLGIPQIPATEIPQILSFDLSTTNRSRLVKISDPVGQTRYIQLIPGQSQHVEIAVLPENGRKVLTFITDEDEPNDIVAFCLSWSKTRLN